MCLFLETIKIEAGRMPHLRWHQRRMNEIFAHFYKEECAWNLGQIIHVPDVFQQGIVKCRVVYNDQTYQIEFIPYQIREIRRIQAVEIDILDYPFKYAKREAFQILQQQFPEADDILIVKNGFLTDSSYANIALFDGQKWVTPNTFLLNGTCRQRLLAEKRITEDEIHLKDLNRYQSVTFFNAMMDFGKGPRIKTENIIPVRSGKL
ncbi:MAG: aminotransferase class IV [Bacteroidetes bacterium]|nr:aminotransferase class IV [Bacteroidota bacterium]